MTRVVKWLALFFLICFLGYVAVCSVATVVEVKSRPAFPDSKQASYVLRIEATGQDIFAKQASFLGTVRGKRLYTIKGYWEPVGNKFVYRDASISLDEKVFGPIEMKRR